MSIVEVGEDLHQQRGPRPANAAPLLQVEDLHTQFSTSRGIVRAVEGVSFAVDRGEVVAIVGESGSGKSVTALSIMRLLPRLTGKIPKGRIVFDGKSLLDLDDEEMRELRGRDISMIFQEPMTSLNPVMTIGAQIMVAVSAPTALALRMAEAAGITLAAIARKDGFEVFTHPHRIIGATATALKDACAAATRTP